jgi:hypothetical protein
VLTDPSLLDQKTDVLKTSVNLVKNNVSLVKSLLNTVLFVLLEEFYHQIVYVQMVNIQMLTTSVKIVTSNVANVHHTKFVMNVLKMLTEDQLKIVLV